MESRHKPTRVSRGYLTIDTWDAAPYDDAGGVTLSRTRVTKTFSGDVEGTSTAELLMVQAPEGSAAYVGMERIEARVNGRAGSFVLHHSATTARPPTAAGNRRAGPSCQTPEPASCEVCAGRHA